MVKFVYDLLTEFSPDDDKWFKFFTKKDLAVIGITAVFTYILYTITSLFGYPLIGLCIGLFIMIVSLACNMWHVPSSYFLNGGGQTIITLIIRRLIRKKNRVIYVRGYDDWRDEN